MAEYKHEYSPHQEFLNVKSASGSEQAHFSVFCSDQPEDIIQNAMKSMNETEEKRVEGLKKLRGFMKRENLKHADDHILLSILRSCKYNYKKSEKKLDNFFKFREMVGRKLANIDIKELERIVDCMGFGLFPYRDKLGRFLIFTRAFPGLDTCNSDLLLLTALTMILCGLNLFPMVSLLGVTYIVDSKLPPVHSWYTLLKIYRPLASNLLAFPVSIKKIEVVNENILVRWFVNVLRPFIPGKIFSRISFNGSGYETLHKHYHPDILPEEFGGSLGPVNHKLYKQKYLDFTEKLKAEYKHE